MNVRFLNGTVSRLGWLQGLPVNDTTSLALDADSLWVGSTRGVARLNFASHSWDYYYLQRYLPGNSLVSAIATRGNSTWIATDGGVSVLETQYWTLAQKAEYYEGILSRHDRVGMVGDCSLGSFGDVSTCINHDDDNNGLWTSLVVGAEAFRFAATGNPEAYERTLHFYNGMKLLNVITGVPGLMARSAVRPGEPHGEGAWHLSTVPGYDGWQWKGV